MVAEMSRRLDMVQTWCKRKTPNLIFDKLGVYLVAHSGFEPLFSE